jgi:ribose transport system ATP-binding protein
VDRLVTTSSYPGKDQDPACRAVRITKTYGQTVVLDGASLELRRGEIHALLGGNGSGKSTFIKVLAGVVRADPGGFIEVGGSSVHAAEQTPALSRQMGFRFVHQGGGFFADMTVAENLALGSDFPTGRLGRINGRRLIARAKTTLDRFDLHLDPSAPMNSLSVGDQMMVAIARVFQEQEAGVSEVLVLDEPTAALPSDEADQVLSWLRRYAKEGRAVLYVTHRLDEVFALADRTTVLRDGAVVLDESTADLTKAALLEAVAGRRLQTEDSRPKVKAQNDDVVLAVNQLSVGPVEQVSFDVRRGEILGIAGLLGSGRSEILHAIFGLPACGGTMTLGGGDYQPRDSRDAMKRGVALLPEDRAAEAAFLDLPVYENASAASFRDYWRHGLFRRRAEREALQTDVRQLNIKAPSAVAPLSFLSGGNQQKVMFSRWTRTAPLLLLLDEPTQGVDVGARADIHREIRSLTESGVAVLIVSSDFDELASLCSRVLILRQGVLGDQLEDDEISVHTLTELAHDTEPVGV